MLTQNAINAGSLVFLLIPLIICLVLFSKAVKLRRREKSILQQEKALANKKLALDTRLSEQRRTDASLLKRASDLSVKEEHMDDLVRSKTISMAHRVASREYLMNTPAFSCIYDPGNPYIPDTTYQRLLSSLTTSFKISSPFDISAKIISESGHSYHTTLYSCSCSDFQFRKTPCKHMLRLALESGLLLNFSTDSLEKDVSSLLSRREELLEESKKLHEFQTSLAKQKKTFKLFFRNRSRAILGCLPFMQIY